MLLDIDECQNPDACTENSDCFNEDGHYRCVCRSGFKSIFKSNQKVCEGLLKVTTFADFNIFKNYFRYKWMWA